MTRQEIFDKVATHLIKQGCKSTTPDRASCMYRSQDGARCAVGIFIPDDVYKPGMEGLNAAQLSSTFPDALPDAVKREMQFLLELQRVHDSAFYSEGRPFIDDISFGLRRFAREFGLDYSIVQRLLRESEVVHGTPSSDDASLHRLP